MGNEDNVNEISAYEFQGLKQDKEMLSRAGLEAAEVYKGTGSGYVDGSVVNFILLSTKLISGTRCILTLPSTCVVVAPYYHFLYY